MSDETFCRKILRPIEAIRNGFRYNWRSKLCLKPFVCIRNTMNCNKNIKKDKLKYELHQSSMGKMQFYVRLKK